MTPLAVIDVETTGLNPYRHDRVVEVAVVIVLPEQGIQTELTTLVNPERDVGPTSIHGLTASDLVDAPRFADIAAHLAKLLRDSSILVGHNVRFDISFLQSEYNRIGIKMPSYTTLDTMVLAGGGTLSACCLKYGVQVTMEDPVMRHCMTPRRLRTFSKNTTVQPSFINQVCVLHAPPAWPTLSTACVNFLPRGSRQCAALAVPSYLQRLAERLSVGSTDSSRPEGEMDYQALLWRVLEDGQIEETEGDSLVDVATHWGLSFERVKAIHLDYLKQLVMAAWADRRITDGERREIQTAAQLLGFGIFSTEQS